MSVALATYMAYGMPHSWEDLKRWGIGAGIVLLTSRFPDIDEPRSGMGALVMPGVPSRLRPLAFVSFGGFCIYYGWTHHQWVLFCIGILYLFFASVKHRDSPTHSLLGFLTVAWIAYLINHDYLVAVIIGYGSHLLLDLITEGVPLFWPYKKRQRIPLMQTNCWLERWVIYRGAQIYIIWAVFQEVKPFFLTWASF